MWLISVNNWANYPLRKLSEHPFWVLLGPSETTALGAQLPSTHQLLQGREGGMEWRRSEEGHVLTLTFLV